MKGDGMIVRGGMSSKQEQHWKLYVPDEHCLPGLEVVIIATEKGLTIGGELICWGDLDRAKKEAQANLPF